MNRIQIVLLLWGAFSVSGGIMYIWELAPMDSGWGIHPSLTKAFKSPRDWYALHRYFGWRLVLYGLTMIAAGLAPLVAPIITERLGEAYAGWLLLCVPMVVIPMDLYTRRFERNLAANAAQQRKEGAT